MDKEIEMKNTFESVIAAIGNSLRNETVSIAVWGYSSNWLCVNRKRLAGEFRVVNAEGDIIASNEFIELCE